MCATLSASPSVLPTKTTPPWRPSPVSKKILFIDRDGTLIAEPADQQIDRLDKFVLDPDCIQALLRLRAPGFPCGMATNQDGLAPTSSPEEQSRPPQKLLLD